MTKQELSSQFWSTLALFFHPRLRLCIARHIYGGINKPITSFTPSLGEKMEAILTDLLTVEDVVKLLQIEALDHKADLTEYLKLQKRGEQAGLLPATPLELTKAMEALLYVFEHRLPHPIVPATQLEIEELRLYEPLLGKKAE